MKQCRILGYAMGSGGSVPGAEGGPSSFRDRQLQSRIAALGWNVSDGGDVSSSDSLVDVLFSDEERLTKNYALVYSACRALSLKTEEALTEGCLPVVLGGDHSFSIGSVAGAANFCGQVGQRIGLIWIDTHPDINTPTSSVSKRIHGMSVSFLLGLNQPGGFSSLQQVSPALLPSQLVYVGIRDVDPPEKEMIRKLAIPAFTMKEVDRRGIGSVILEAIEIASRDTAGFVVSFDLDVCDPSLVPGTGTPIRGGLTYREIHLIMELLYDSQKMLSLEVVELNPKLDLNFQTAELGVSLIESAMGKSILA